MCFKQLPTLTTNIDNVWYQMITIIILILIIIDFCRYLLSVWSGYIPNKQIISPSIFPKRLIHDSGLDDVSGGSHRGRHEASAAAGHHVDQVVVLELGVPQNEALGRVVGGQVSQIDECRPLNVRYRTWTKKSVLSLSQRFCCTFPESPDPGSLDSLKKRVH